MRYEAGMDITNPDHLIALAYAGTSREKLRFLLAFDERLGRIVAVSREPVIAQMKLAWWRENLDKAAANANKGEQMLAAAHAFNLGPDLIAMVNGWEALLGEMPLSDQDLQTYATGRGTLFGLLGGNDAIKAGAAWALTDFAMRCSDSITRDRALTLAEQFDYKAKLPTPLAILATLARSDRKRGPAQRWVPGSPKRMLRAFATFLFRQ
jgi:15-cis-phytoene synthase